MKTTTLGRTGIEVTEVCLGTMTWGNQTDEADAHRQIDMALDHGITFMDTAEMYPVNPVRAETVGRTEEFIGSWIGRTGRRGDWVIATKITGRNGAFVRQGQDVTGAAVREALEASLKRLRTDYVDLYQLHWPNRGSYHFRQMWGFDARGRDIAAIRAHMAEVMETLKDLVAEGKIRAFGLSNETAWGTTEWLRAAEATGGPRIETMQNEYSLLCRLYDTDMAETCLAEDITLLAYSPLAAGLLTGKYQNGAVPPASRMALNGDLGGRKTERVFGAVDAYLGIAKRHGLDPVKMAIAWCLTRPFPIVPILGATTAPQLGEQLGAEDMVLSPEVLAEIGAAHKAHPLPF
jgi:aryl-alcohol dehydrogenase-like predicted oxidoreductase